MSYKELNEEERFIYDWQYGMLGGFKSALVHAIAMADDINIERLRLGFPDEVSGYEKFTTVDGWWERVQSKEEN